MRNHMKLNWYSMQLWIFLALLLTSYHHLSYSGCMEERSQKATKIKASKRPEATRAPVVLRDSSFPALDVRVDNTILEILEQRLECNDWIVVGTPGPLRKSVVALFENMLSGLAGKTVKELGETFDIKLMRLADRWGLEIECFCRPGQPSRLEVWRRTDRPKMSWRLRHSGDSDKSCGTSQVLPELRFMPRSDNARRRRWW